MPRTHAQITCALALIVAVATIVGGVRQLERARRHLARAGYVAVSFDCEGHGGNPRPMSGDVPRIEGTTQKLMAVIPWVTRDVVRRKVFDHCGRAPNPNDVTPPCGSRSHCHQVASR